MADEARLALAEPAGESPPFIGASGTFYWADGWTEFPWEAIRLSKNDAMRLSLTMYPSRVTGWRHETNEFILRANRYSSEVNKE